MRAPTRYERFLDKRPRTYTDDYDDEENLKEFAKYMRPIWEYSGLYNIYRKYANIAYNTTTAKGYFEKLLSIEYKGNALFPPNLVNCGMEMVQLQKELAQELLADKMIDESIIDSQTFKGVVGSNKIIDEQRSDGSDEQAHAGRAYEDGTNNLIVSVENSDAAGTSLNNPDLMKYTVPQTKTGSTLADYTGAILLNTSRYYSSEEDTQNIDNATETIKLYNDVGRRVYTVLGNAKVSSLEGIYEATYDEMDSSATEVITLSPPTGIEQSLMFTIQLMSVILSSMAILAGGIVIIKKKLFQTIIIIVAVIH